MNAPANKLTLHISDDHMVVSLSCSFADTDLSDLVPELESALEEHGLPALGGHAQLEALLAEIARMGDTADRVPFLKGVPPEAPADGYIEWTADFFNSDFCVDPETGNIDYRRRAAQSSVVAGQCLARIIAPKAGRDGINVFGERIKTAAPKSARIRAGKGAEFREAEQACFAKVDGRIRWEREILYVDDVITIPDSVGLRSGNVEHNGAVIVQKDVEPGSTLHARGDVEVYGLIDGAEVVTRGNLTVHSGIIGRPGVTVRVSGSVHARFINECVLEADGDVTVEREIVNSVVRTRGRIYVPRGAIVGGEMTAGAGVFAGETGSEGYVRTVIRAGTDFRLHHKIAEIEAERKAIEQRLARIEEVLAPLLPGVRNGNLPDDQREAVVQLINKDKELRAHVATIAERIEAARQDSQEHCKFIVEVSRQIHPETVLFFDHERMHFRDGLLGPITARLVKDRILLK